MNPILASNRRYQSIVELVLAILLSVVIARAAFSNILSIPDGYYNITSDALGHFAKVEYLAEHYKNFQFPSWYPYWYNGSTVYQYYPPLGYVIMGIIHVFTNSMMTTMSLYCFICLLIGNMGVWALGHRYLGSWYGLWGIVLYGLQPFLALSFFAAGVLAQGVLFMLTPWLLYFAVTYLDSPSRSSFILVSILTALAILGHAMHAYMECFCIGLVALPYVITGRLKVRSFINLIFSIAIGATICGVWWVVGISGYEAPGVPHLLKEAIIIYTATLDWYLPSRGQQLGLHFGFSTLLFALTAIVIYRLKNRNTKWREGDEQFAISFCLYLSLFSMIFSFGDRVPFFNFIPLSDSLVPGRILSFTAVLAAFAGAYTLKLIMLSPKSSKGKYFSIATAIVVICLSLWDLNPYKTTYNYMDYDSYYAEYMPYVAGEGNPFEKGRYQWVAPVNCAETYYSTVRYGLNTSDGWNIEGTPHNRSIWSYNVALVSGAEDYVLKDALFWNIRSLFTLESRKGLIDALVKHGFELAATQSDGGALYTSDAPSSYFLIDPRDCLIVGDTAGYIALEFPFMVHNFETDLTKYPLEELAKYQLIYIVDPPLDNLHKIQKFEQTIAWLVKSDTHIIIEPSLKQKLPICGVTTYNFLVDAQSTLKKNSAAEFNSSLEELQFESNQLFLGLRGLDETYYNMVSTYSSEVNDIVGVKNYAGGEVYFIGKHLSQYLKSPNIYIYGYRENYTHPYSAQIKTLLEDLFNLKPHNTSYVPENFPALTTTWGYRGGSFVYESIDEKEVTISVTHTPRWKIQIDGDRIDYLNRENLIVVTLPAGKHEVEMRYGISSLGLIGYCITAFGALLLVIYALKYERIQLLLERVLSKIKNYLNLP